MRLYTILRYIDRDKLWEEFVKHDWGGLSKERDLILSHIESVLRGMPDHNEEIRKMYERQSEK